MAVLRGGHFFVFSEFFSDFLKNYNGPHMECGVGLNLCIVGFAGSSTLSFVQKFKKDEKMLTSFSTSATTAPVAPKRAQTTSDPKPLNGKHFCLAGSFSRSRWMMEKLIHAKGGMICYTISPIVDVLVVGDYAQEKLRKAEEIGSIEVMDEWTLRKMIEESERPKGNLQKQINDNLRILGDPLPEVRSGALNFLGKHLPSKPFENWYTTDVCLFVAGQFNHLTKPAMEKFLESCHIKTSPEITSEVTHILVGERVGEKLVRKIIRSKKPLVVEFHLPSLF